MSVERQKKFSIGNKTFIAKFPNVGQIIDLESYKQALTSNRYGQMAQSGVASMYYALDLVDSIAFFQIVVPEVAKFYDISNFASIEVDTAENLIEAYRKDIKPWYEKTLAELKGLKADGDNSETETSEN